MLEGQSVSDDDSLTVLTDISTDHLTQMCHFVTTGRLYAAKLDPLLVGSFANLGIDLNSLSFEQVLTQNTWSIYINLSLFLTRSLTYF